MFVRRILILGLLITLVASLAPRAIAAPAIRPYTWSSSPSVSTLSVPAKGVYLGVWQQGMPADTAGLSSFEQHAAKHAAIVMFWRAMGGYSGTLTTAWLRAIAAQGSVPMITWEPANWDPGSDQSPYTLTNIATGRLDSYLGGWANQLKAYGGPVLLRWAHEMNGTWYPWGGQSSAQYIAAWRHIHALFVAHGATNVQWVWSPNVQWNQPSQFAPYFPGDSEVNWIALDGYNKPQNGWQTFSQIFTGSYHAITTLSAKPLMIAETASSEPTPAQAAVGDSKAAWIMDTFTHAIPALPRIKAVLWFNEDKTHVENCTCDWPIESSSRAQQAFAQAVSSPYYLSSYP